MDMQEGGDTPLSRKLAIDLAVKRGEPFAECCTLLDYEYVLRSAGGLSRREAKIAARYGEPAIAKARDLDEASFEIWAALHRRKSAVVLPAMAKALKDDAPELPDIVTRYIVNFGWPASLVLQ